MDTESKIVKVTERGRFIIYTNEHGKIWWVINPSRNHDEIIKITETGKFTFYRNEYGGVWWTVNSPKPPQEIQVGGVSLLLPINHDDVMMLIAETIHDKYFIGHTKKVMCEIRSLASCRNADINRILDLIQNGTASIVEIPGNAYERFIIYMMCHILGLKYELWKEDTRKLIRCDHFLPESEKDGYWCGCEYAPSKFWKYHSHNSYDDDIAYGRLPWTNKLGVRVYR